MRPVWISVFISLAYICDAQNDSLDFNGSNGGGALNLGGGGGAINLGGESGPVNLGGEGAGEGTDPLNLGGVDGPTSVGGGEQGPGVELGGGAGRDEAAGGGLGGRSGGGTQSGTGFGGLDLSGAAGNPGAGGAIDLGGRGTGSGGAPTGIVSGDGAGSNTAGPDPATGPGVPTTNQATGGISIDEGSGTVNPNTGPEVASVANTGNNAGNSNDDNNVGPGSNFGSGAAGFGNINFPDFASNFGNIGNNFPRDNNVGGAGGLGGNPNANGNVFGSFPGFGSNIGTGTGLPNPNTNPDTNNNNLPGGNRFPSLDLNNNFNFGNTGNGGGIRFPGDFNTNTFPGLDNIRFPPFSNANAGGFGEECRTPPEEPLPYKVDNSSVPQQVLQQIQQEFGLRPELQLIAQWFSATQGQPAALPQDSIDQVSCPADYHVLTRFVSAQNAECFVLPPPTQDPVVYAKCRCQRCREAPTGRPNRVNQCKSLLTPTVLTVFCPLSSPVRIFPMRVQIPTSCRCMLAQPQVRRGL